MSAWPGRWWARSARSSATSRAQYRQHLLLALSYAGFFLNLFNLIPLSPFDGGRITAVISPRVWLIGVPILVALFFCARARC